MPEQGTFILQLYPLEACKPDLKTPLLHSISSNGIGCSQQKEEWNLEILWGIVREIALWFWSLQEMLKLLAPDVVLHFAKLGLQSSFSYLFTNVWVWNFSVFFFNFYSTRCYTHKCINTHTHKNDETIQITFSKFMLTYSSKTSFNALILWELCPSGSSILTAQDLYSCYKRWHIILCSWTFAASCCSHITEASQLLLVPVNQHWGAGELQG